MSDETPEQTEPQTAVDTTSSEAPPAEAKSRYVIHVPKWVVFLIAAVVLFGGGFGIGWAAAPGGGHGAFPFPGARIERPFSPGGNFFGPGGGNGGGGQFQSPAQGGAFLGVETGAASGTSGAAVVSVVSGGPADQAGLKAGDVITAVDGTTVSSAAALAQQIQSHQPGDQVTITYTRGGASAQASVKLGTRSSTTTPTAPPA